MGVLSLRHESLDSLDESSGSVACRADHRPASCGAPALPLVSGCAGCGRTGHPDHIRVIPDRQQLEQALEGWATVGAGEAPPLSWVEGRAALWDTLHPSDGEVRPQTAATSEIPQLVVALRGLPGPTDTQRLAEWEAELLKSKRSSQPSGDRYRPRSLVLVARGACHRHAARIAGRAEVQHVRGGEIESPDRSAGSSLDHV